MSFLCELIEDLLSAIKTMFSPAFVLSVWSATGDLVINVAIAMSFILEFSANATDRLRLVKDYTTETCS
jgi:hypothetical protein